MRGMLLAAALFMSSLLAHAAGTFTLSSPDIKADATIAAKFIYKGYGCHGENISPTLIWHNTPAGTKSFALTVHDPDARGGSGWWHWLIFDIPATTMAISQGSIPADAVEARNDFGAPAYGGPCPPVGDKPHHYVFTIYALGVDHLDAADSTDATTVNTLINRNKIGQASFTSLYSR